MKKKIGQRWEYKNIGEIYNSTYVKCHCIIEIIQENINIDSDRVRIKILQKLGGKDLHPWTETPLSFLSSPPWKYLTNQDNPNLK